MTLESQIIKSLPTARLLHGGNGKILLVTCINSLVTSRYLSQSPKVSKSIQKHTFNSYFLPVVTNGTYRTFVYSNNMFNHWVVPCNCHWVVPCNCHWVVPCNCHWVVPCNCHWVVPCNCHWVVPCSCRCCSFLGNMGGSTNPVAQLNPAFPYC